MQGGCAGQPGPAQQRHSVPRGGGAATEPALQRRPSWELALHDSRLGMACLLSVFPDALIQIK
jgi:hypothetical protein